MNHSFINSVSGKSFYLHTMPRVCFWLIVCFLFTILFNKKSLQVWTFFLAPVVSYKYENMVSFYIETILTIACMVACFKHFAVVFASYRRSHVKTQLSGSTFTCCFCNLHQIISKLLLQNVYWNYLYLANDPCPATLNE